MSSNNNSYYPYSYNIALASPTQMPESSLPQQNTAKRKRKSVDVVTTDDEDGFAHPNVNGNGNGSANGSGVGSAGQESAASLKKRTKTQRACDSCRSRKIRCDVLPNTDPPLCKHCKQYTFECTFFLPITETRFKKKQASGGTGKTSPSPLSPITPGAGSSLDALPIPPSPHPRRPPPPRRERERDESLKIMGPTDVTYLLHSTATVPQKAYDEFDAKYHHRWDVRGTDGIIHVVEQPTSSSSVQSAAHPSLGLSKDTLQSLVNRYFSSFSPLLPIITKEEFLASSTHAESPILLYAVCAVAATHRCVPQSSFVKLRGAVNSLIKNEDVCGTPRLSHVKALLILGMCGDIHGSHVPSALSLLWVRVGTAIRMAQDLGLHRTESILLPERDPEGLEMRRRVWAGAVVSDRWCALTYGHPCMIDVEDCDARLPSGGGEEDVYMDELVRLSLLLGKVMKMIYSPTGLTRATDAGLINLLHLLDTWKSSLPPHLQFTSPSTASTHAGLLHLLYSCVSMIFWRVFMRISYTCPAHLKFSLSVERWSALVCMTRESIEWLDFGFGEGEGGSGGREGREGGMGRNEGVYDCWLIVAYAATSCALVQYHTWARRRDKQAMRTLKRLRDTVQRWEVALSPDHMSARRKTAEIITLLYEATQQPPPAPRSDAGASDDTNNTTTSAAVPIAPGLNPTPGVERKTMSLRGLAFKRDESRPGGGIFVADRGTMVRGNLPSNTVVEKESENGDVNGVEKEGEKEGDGKAGTTGDGVPYLFPTPARGGVTQAQMQIDTFPPSNPPPPPPSVPPPQQQQQQQQQPQPLPLHPQPSLHQQQHLQNPLLVNLNPQMNLHPQPPGVLVMSVPDHHQQTSYLDGSAMSELVGADQVLEGLPGSMFDWEQWDTYFSRFNGIGGDVGVGVGVGGGYPGPSPGHGQGHGMGGGYPYSATRGE